MTASPEATSLQTPRRSDGAPLFDAILTPHRSLSPPGFAVLMGVVAAVNIGLGVSFMLRGAWPILAFCGLDVLLFYVLFRLNYRSARMYERVRLLPDELIVERHDVGGRRQSWTFQPYWLRVAMDDPPRHDSQLVLRSHGRALTIGSFLSPAERLDLAQALRRVLRAQPPADL
ncbi:MAG: DUF2244 domain-containing protein [Dongiaceae bacterium]